MVHVWPNHWRRPELVRASSPVIWPYHNYSLNECNNPIIIYLLPHFRDVLREFMFYIRPDKALEDRILAVVGCKNSQKIYIIIAIATDQ